MKILKLIILSFIVSLISFSCDKEKIKKKNDKPTIITSSTIMKNNLPYTSDNAKKYYELNSDSTMYVINPLHENLVSDNFNEKNKSVLLKENDFGIQLNPNYKYYVLETFKFSNVNTIKLIIYNTFGENDSKILNLQLNSYINDVLVDQLLVDCRFTFETEYYRTFKIDSDKNIEITKYSVVNLEYNEQGDIIGKKKSADTTKEKINYRLDLAGKFLKNKI